MALSDHFLRIEPDEEPIVVRSFDDATEHWRIRNSFGFESIDRYLGHGRHSRDEPADCAVAVDQRRCDS